MSNFEEKVYAFTTEDIKSYFEFINMKNKSVLTVGSSGDQAFNALLLGAKDVTVFDINPNTYDYIQFKREMLLKNDNITDFYNNIIYNENINYSPDLFSIRDLRKMSNYFSSEEDYQKLRNILSTTNIDFVCGNIYDMSSSLEGTYDIILLSNILDYLNEVLRGTGINPRDYLRTSFEEWQKHLNEDGIIQLAYLYYNEGNPLKKDIVFGLSPYLLEMVPFQNQSNNDIESSIITYTKRR